MLTIEIPRADPIRLEHLVLDINGTLTNRGELIDGVEERLGRLAGDLTPHIVTADTLGTAIELGARLGVSVTIIRTGADKAAFVRRIGAQGTVAIGNGRNDEAMLHASRLGSRSSGRRARLARPSWWPMSYAAQSRMPSTCSSISGPCSRRSERDGDDREDGTQPPTRTAACPLNLSQRARATST